jgi:2OG-Fe(II) oxygenase superfamily
MRYECHVDSNPLEGLLYVTDHPPGTGGELVVSNRGDVPTAEEVDRDATLIYPVAGHLVFFNGSCHSHYVRPLIAEDGVRVVAAMNYYTPSLPESARPPDLNRHLFGED